MIFIFYWSVHCVFYSTQFIAIGKWVTGSQVEATGKNDQHHTELCVPGFNVRKLGTTHLSSESLVFVNG